MSDIVKDHGNGLIVVPVHSSYDNMTVVRHVRVRKADWLANDVEAMEAFIVADMLRKDKHGCPRIYDPMEPE